ncbi:MAG TPA: hypothetical protein VK154_17605 [Chitinophagales bacterium]|nr:hypothetical protein [Chitinophagales bacterium]
MKRIVGFVIKTLFATMNKLKTISALILISIMLGGCPYESAVPIDEQSIKINPMLLGTWQSEKSEKYIVTKGSNDYTYTIEEIAEDKKPVTYSAYLSLVGSDYFLNITTGQSKFMFYKIVLDKMNKSIQLSSVTENIDETFKTSKELKAYFIKHKELSFFFEKEEIELTKQK